jgi:hypothetical protein
MHKYLRSICTCADGVVLLAAPTTFRHPLFGPWRLFSYFNFNMVLNDHSLYLGN